MDRIRKKLKSVSRRLIMVTFIDSFLRGLFLAFILLSVFLLACKFFLLDSVMVYACAGIGGLLLLYSLIGVVKRRGSLFHSAVAVDGELRLKERISSALLHHDDASEAAAALRKDALSVVDAINVRENFPLRVPREFKWVFIPVLVAVALFFCPHILDVTGAIADEKIKIEDNEKTKKDGEDLKKRIEKIKKETSGREISKELKDAILAVEELMEKMKRSPGDKQKLLQMASKIESKLKDSLGRSRFGKPGKGGREKGKEDEFDTLKKFADAMKSNNMQRAKNEWKKVVDKWKKAKGAEKEKIARELARMSRTLKAKNLDPELAEALKKLSKALEDLAAARKQGDAGKEDAAKFEELADEMSEEAMKALEKLLKDKEKLAKLLDAIKRAKQRMRQNNTGKDPAGLEGEGGDDWSFVLPGEEEDMGEDWEGDDSEGAGQGEDEGEGGGLGKGKGNRRWLIRLGRGGTLGQAGQGNMGGMGGKGQGRGGKAPEREHDTGKIDTKVDSTEGSGPVILGKTFLGKGARGDTTIKYKEYAKRVKDETSEAIDRDKVPSWQRKIVTKYFDDLQQIIEKEKEDNPKPPEKKPE